MEIGEPQFPFPFPGEATPDPSRGGLGQSPYPVIQWAPLTARESEGVPEPVIQWGEFEPVRNSRINFLRPRAGSEKFVSIDNFK